MTTASEVLGTLQAYIATNHLAITELAVGQFFKITFTTNAASYHTGPAMLVYIKQQYPGIRFTTVQTVRG